jgi:hypothetical protein
MLLGHCRLLFQICEKKPRVERAAISRRERLGGSGARHHRGDLVFQNLGRGPFLSSWFDERLKSRFARHSLNSRRVDPVAGAVLLR